MSTCLTYPLLKNSVKVINLEIYKSIFKSYVHSTRWHFWRTWNHDHVRYMLSPLPSVVCLSSVCL